MYRADGLTASARCGGLLLTRLFQRPGLFTSGRHHHFCAGSRVGREAPGLTALPLELNCADALGIGAGAVARIQLGHPHH